MAPRLESSDSESSSESESNSVEELTNIERGSRSSEDSNSDSEMEDTSRENDSDNGDSSAESSESEDEELAPAASTQHSTAIPQTEFKPPAGFKTAKSQATPSTALSSVLSNLRNKQVFHITAPSFLPLSKVKEVSLAKIMQGEPVLVHEGVSYGIPAEDLSQQDSSKKALLLYDAKTHTYFSATTSDIQSYHVQEMINFPRRMNLVPPNATTAVKPPKPQPKHLKMRFRPVGSGQAPPETLGSSSESEGELSTVKRSKGEERKRKHPHTEVDGNQPGAVPRKKSKKQTSSQEDGLASSQVTIGTPSTDERGRDKAKKLKKDRDETSQERRTRREEKKKKKKADKAA